MYECDAFRCFILLYWKRGWNLQETALVCNLSSVGILQEALDVEYF